MFERLNLEAKEHEAELVMYRLRLDDLVQVAEGFRKHCFKNK